MSTLNCENGIDPVGINLAPTGNSATFGIQTEVITNAGYTLYNNLAAFVVHNGNIVSITDGIDISQPQFVTANIWGNDSTTDELDGVPDGGELEFYFLNGSDVFKVNGLTDTYSSNLVYVLKVSTTESSMQFNDQVSSSQFEYYCSLLLTDFESLDNVDLLQEIQFLQYDVDYLTEELFFSEAEVEMLKSEISQSSLTISTLEQTISNLNSEIGQLNSKISQLEQSAEFDQTQIENLIQSVDTLQTIRENLNAQISVLETANNSLVAAQESNNATISSLNSQIETLLSENNVSQSQIDSLTNQIQDAGAFSIDEIYQQLNEIVSQGLIIDIDDDLITAPPPDIESVQEQINAIIAQLSNLMSSNSQIQTILDAYNAEPVVIYEETTSSGQGISNEIILYAAIGLGVLILATRK